MVVVNATRRIQSFMRHEGAPGHLGCGCGLGKPAQEPKGPGGTAGRKWPGGGKDAGRTEAERSYHSEPGLGRSGGHCGVSASLTGAWPPTAEQAGWCKSRTRVGPASGQVQAVCKRSGFSRLLITHGITEFKFYLSPPCWPRRLGLREAQTHGCCHLGIGERTQPRQRRICWARKHRSLFWRRGPRVGLSPGCGLGANGAEGLSVAHPCGHLFL